MSEHGHDGVGPPPQHHGLPPAGLLQPHGLAAPALRGLAPAPVPATAAAHRAVTPAQRHQQILFTCDRYFYFPHRLKVGMMARGSGWGTEAMTTRGAVTSWATPGQDTCTGHVYWTRVSARGSSPMGGLEVEFSLLHITLFLINTRNLLEKTRFKRHTMNNECLSLGITVQ